LSILGVGTDLVEIARIEKIFCRFAERLVTRILHEQERAALAGREVTARLLAKRFAAKEAAAKALGTGFRNGMRLTDIAVDHDALGRPMLVLHGQARVRAEQLGVTRIDISLSDERDHALAFVIMSRDR